MHYFKSLILIVLFTILVSAAAFAQLEGLHGDFANHRNGVHAGNQFRTTIYNDGTFGTKQTGDYGGEWPINTGHIYMLDGNVFVGAEVLDATGEVTHIVSDVTSAGDGSAGSWSSGDTGPNGEWWTFLPLPNFASADTNKIAMSKWKWAWPDFWPDKIDDPVDPGWPGQWNGYFGKDVFNADEEAFFVSDDYMNKEFNFYPDVNDSSRKGLGIRMWVRTFEWSNALVEDGMFALFDLENIGTYEHDKVVFGYKFGNNMGDVMNGSGDSGDDMGAFNQEEDVAFLYDYDDIGGGGWTPVGYFGGAFLESPGNQYDGIDNDGDGSGYAGPVIEESMFMPRTLNTGDDIVLIDYKTFQRTLTKMGTDTVKTYYQDLVFKFWPGKAVEEVQNNLVDDNLNGIIDENNGSTIGEPGSETTRYLYVGLKYHDYLTGAGSDNILLDEQRDDFVDNDGDWNILTDDVGYDGVAFSGDPGEGDGMATSGAGTEFPGEPHIDKTDIDETDMIGLTSFKLYIWEDMPHYQDELVWGNITPGYFDNLLENANIELLYGSGYFPMVPTEVQRFSMGILCGINADDYMINARWIAKAYNENYNFSKAPNIPKLTAIPGDRRVTLLWDDFAEQSYDPIAGRDFEGYRIYRSTDPGWNDMIPISDGYGSTTYRKPVVQFDLNNEYSGYAPVSIKGIRFDLGTNTGLVHSWTDTTVVNGQKYYYAITSYDHGMPESGIAPSECSKFISISTSGEIDKGSNVAIVRPEAPVSGYVDAKLDGFTLLEGSRASGKIGYKIIDRTVIPSNHNFRVIFEDTLIKDAAGVFTPITKTLSLIDITAVPPDTMINKSPAVAATDQLPIVSGFQLKLQNVAELTLNTDSTRWSRPDVYGYVFQGFRYSTLIGTKTPDDYMIEFGQVGIDTASEVAVSKTRTLPAIPVNFRITNTITGKNATFGFWEKDVLSGEEGKFTGFTDKTRTDQVVLFETDQDGNAQFSWSFELDTATNDTLHTNPQPGDVLRIKTDKPFLSADVFEFTSSGVSIDDALAAAQIDRIRVVPNPYIVSNRWEPLNPYSNGRGPRELHFTHLPQKCTIRIYNVRGQLVRELEHVSESESDGTLIWDMQSKDLLDIAYGVYIYHVDAGEAGIKIGKFAVIK
ncbi:MAG: hypothetical protein EHM72_03500 [Calditrichaeota bacterium]|nr:MAG: hypothetical protein EHM72_03500 [Calditrichota bacterium]